MQPRPPMCVDQGLIGSIPLHGLSMFPRRVVQFPLLCRCFYYRGRGQCERAVLAVKVARVALVGNVIHGAAAFSTETSVAARSIPSWDKSLSRLSSDQRWREGIRRGGRRWVRTTTKMLGRRVVGLRIGWRGSRASRWGRLDGYNGGHMG